MFKKYDVVTIVVSIALMALLVVGTIFAPEVVVGTLAAMKSFVIYKFGWAIILVVAGIAVFTAWICFSKYGNIRMGKTNPEYGWFGYAAMIFCAAMGSSMIFWPSIEWAEYIVWEGVWPFGWGMAEMYEYAMSYSYFHWGFIAWAVYAVGIIPIGYRYYVMKKPGLTIQGACEGVFGEKATQGWLGTVINIIFIVGILGGLTITYGTGIPMITNFLHVVAGTPETFLVNLILILILTAVFTWSAMSGVSKGILNLSRMCIWVCCIMLAVVLVFGNTGFILNETIHSLGLMFQNFAEMTFNTGATATGQTFAGEWTVFYWAWWVGLAPVMWIFIAKCSKGRTIKNIVATTVGAGFLATVLFFGIIEGNGLAMYVDFDWTTIGTGTTPLDAFYNTWNEYAFISDTLTATTPFPKLIIGIWFIGAFILLVTTMDSSAYTMAAATQKNVGTDAEPVKPLRLFWAVLLPIAPLCILAAGSGTSSCTAVVIITAVPVLILVIASLIGSTKWMISDFGKMSKEDIIEFFKPEEEAPAAIEAEATEAPAEA